MREVSDNNCLRIVNLTSKTKKVTGAQTIPIREVGSHIEDKFVPNVSGVTQQVISRR